MEKTYLRLLQLGLSGSGKTHRALQLAKLSFIEILDVDNKAPGLVKKLGLGADKVRVHKITTMEELVAAINLIKNDPREATVIVDTWSSFHLKYIEWYLRKSEMKRHSVPSIDGLMISQMSLADWGGVATGENHVLHNILFPLKKHIIVNAHVGRASDSEGKSILTVGTTGKYGESMPDKFPECHYLAKDMLGGQKVFGRATQAMVASTQVADINLVIDGTFKNPDLSILFKDMYEQK